MSNLSLKGVIAADDFIVETILTGLALNEDLSKYWICAQSEKRRQELKQKYNINATTDLDFVKEAHILILAFRFEDARDTLTKLAKVVHEDTILISAVPGIATVFINGFFPKNQIVRLTFNPSIISGEGLAAYVANDRATGETKTLARNMLSSFGKIVEVGNEDEFEKVRRFIFTNTFLSYIVVKSMVDAAQKVGFSTEQAGVLIDQIVKGASRTLITFNHAGNEMFRDGLRNTEFTNRAIESIKEYGIYDAIERYMTTKDPHALFEAEGSSNLGQFSLSYDWFQDAVSK